MNGDRFSRREVTAGLGATIAAGGFGRAFASPAPVLIDDLAAGAPISPFIYGSNETGAMDGGGASVDFDRPAGVTVRRLGGDLITCYNWRNNATNAGKDYKHANGAFLLETLQVAPAMRARPAAVIDAFLANSRAASAQSLVTLPLAGFVAADFDGPVAPEDTAPSRRFAPLDWSRAATPGAVDIPALLALLVDRHGGAAAGGIRGYYLDNEPDLWTQTHPRIVRNPTTITSLIARSLVAAKAIKAADPDAWVLGPASWGATGMATLQNASDWPDYRAHENFLAAYLDAFRRESERTGQRLLDFLDVHWYPMSRRGALFRTEDPALAPALLAAPRSLDEPGFCEDSWVVEALGCSAGPGLHLPLLPSLSALVRENFPGLGLSFGEYNYGGAGRVASGLAMADVLGRFGRSGVAIATHWGALTGWIGEAFRLYRQTDSAGESFGATSLPVCGAGADLSLFSARSDKDRIHLVVINKSERPARLELCLASGRAPALRETLGFDESRPRCGPIEEAREPSAAGLLMTAPPLSARRYRLA